MSQIGILTVNKVNGNAFGRKIQLSFIIYIIDQS